MFDKVSFELKAGETLAIFGGVGAGKTTLIQLLMRIYDIDEGMIYIDGHPIYDYDIQDLRRQMGYVPQDVFLFSDSIANNIRFCRPDANHSDIIEASKQADLYANIQTLPNQFETVVGERGLMLSGGQKQRVSIARVLIKDFAVLLLDDCLSAVDTQTEDNILNNLKNRKEKGTILIASHRVSCTKLADKILLLDQARVVDLGTLAEIMERNPKFRELYHKQTSESQT